MNNLDKQYLELVQDILKNGVKKETRNGGTISVFGRQIRHKMSDGFPLLTTKKLHWKSIVTELIWFLRGDTNIKWLLEQDNTIWIGDSYKNYLKHFDEIDPIEKMSSGSIMIGATKPYIPFTQEEFINKIKTDDVFAKKWGDLGPIYGKQWRNWKHGKEQFKDEEGKFWLKFEHYDQIKELIEQLIHNPDSRRLMVNAWNVGELSSMVLPPCHFSWQVYTRELNLDERAKFHPTPEMFYNINGVFSVGNSIEDSDLPEETRAFFHNELDKGGVPKRAISLMWNQRSVDTGLGLPFNIASYGLLLEIIAKAVNMVPDELIGNLGDVHLYSNHVEPIKEQFREPFPLPALNINTEFWPTESGECGVGPISALSVFNSFNDDNFCKCLLENDIQLVNYQSHPTIKLPLSN